jgi:molybdopterin converting factor small subunit
VSPVPVTVVLPGALRQFSGGEAHLSVPLADGSSLGDLLDAVALTHPALTRRMRDEQGELRRFVNVYVDGEDARLSGGIAAPVAPTAEVLILPSVAGG